MGNVIQIACPCGNTLIVAFDPSWTVNLVGVIQFRCNNCGLVFNTPGLIPPTVSGPQAELRQAPMQPPPGMQQPQQQQQPGKTKTPPCMSKWKWRRN